MVVPPLTLLALDALVRGFAARPSLRGIPPKFANAVATRLPVDLDVTITAPNVDDETYWKRVATELHRWTKAEVTQHGGSWKQLTLERFVAARLESFGVQADLPAEYEDDFCRPPMDATHVRWGTLYPKVPTTRSDGRPHRERTSANTVAAEGPDGAPQLDADMVLAQGPPTGWPHLERLKALAVAAVAGMKKAHAWANVDVAELRAADVGGVSEGAAVTAKDIMTQLAAGTVVPPVGGSGAGAGGGTGGAAGGAAAPAAKPQSSSGGRGGGKGGKGAAAPPPEAPPPPSNPLMKPFPAAAGHILEVEGSHKQRREDVLDSRGTGAQLREYVTPEELDVWRKTAAWPAERRGSLLDIRHAELRHLLDQIAAVQDFVFSLRLDQLPSHLDAELILSRLPNLTSLYMTYGMRHLGMRYDRSLFGMRISDADSLARCLRMTDSLTHLALPCNMIDDGTLVVLTAGLLENHTITHLDLSHNAITSHGVQVLAHMLRAPSQLAALNLSDNKIDDAAGKPLGTALAGNDSLEELILRLNGMGDDGAKALLEGCVGNATLTTLSLSSNR